MGGTSGRLLGAVVGVVGLLLDVSPSFGQQSEPVQVEFKQPTPLLSPDGTLAAWGWARRATMTYNREAVPAERRGRLKEWEHYTIMSPEFTVGVTIAQLGSLVFGSVEVIDYPAKAQKSSLFMEVRSKDQSVFPSTPYGKTEFRRKENFVSMDFHDGRRTIVFQFAATAAAPSFEGRLELRDDPKEDSIAITRPFKEPGQFFYENKIFGMPASGSVKMGDKTYTLPQGQSFAIFDWGRGIWPRESQWFWGQAAGVLSGRRVAINLGHGYGDDSRGSANAILINGKLHKLGRVDCQFDPADRMKPWKFTSDDGALRLTFQPRYPQETKQNIGLAAAELHKIHGWFSGSLLVDGQTIEVDRLLGFAEHMQQRW
jgi:hypothetical protein